MAKPFVDLRRSQPDGPGRSFPTHHALLLGPPGGRRAGGLPPGKYRIAVRQWDPYPDTDKLGGKFDAQNSPIVREITGEEDIVIDLSKPGR